VQRHGIYDLLGNLDEIITSQSGYREEIYLTGGDIGSRADDFTSFLNGDKEILTRRGFGLEIDKGERFIGAGFRLVKIK
jgi:hypothetical protein